MGIEAGALTPLERGQLWVMRIRAVAVAAVLLVPASLLDMAVREQTGTPRGTILLPVAIVLVWLVFLAPGRRYRAWGYRMDEDELQVRHGVWTQTDSLVPLKRIQHIDVAQGPLERAFGVCRLIVHTAGTMHSQVALPGLSREGAERMRDEIRARIRQEPE